MRFVKKMVDAMESPKTKQLKRQRERWYLEVRWSRLEEHVWCDVVLPPAHHQPQTTRQHQEDHRQHLPFSGPEKTSETSLHCRLRDTVQHCIRTIELELNVTARQDVCNKLALPFCSIAKYECLSE